MKPSAPRRPLHEGSVLASGYLLGESLGAGWLARALRLWRPGVRLLRWEGVGVVVLLPLPERVHSDGSLGTPLAAVPFAGSTVLAAGPYSEAELRGADAQPMDLACCLAGRLRVVSLSRLAPLRLEASLDLGELRWVDAEPLLAPPPAVQAPPPAVDPRVLFEEVVPRDAAQTAAARALERRGRGRSSTAVPSATVAKGNGGALRWRVSLRGAIWLLVGGNLLLRLATPWAAGSLLPLVASAVATAGALTVAWRLAGAARDRWASKATATPPEGPGVLAGRPGRRIGALGRALRRWALQSRLGEVLGRRQAAYLGEMLELFQRADLDEALRRALPLGDPGAPGGELALALGVPPRRESLALTAGRAQTATVALGDGLLEHLRTVYRAAFARLAAAGRLDEAAFVLAELLHESDAAVSFLEEHGRLRQAALLAEARDLPPGLAVRLWFRAGDTARALALAKARGAFSDAVERLARAGRADEEGALRLLWADTLASAGRFAEALDAVGPLLTRAQAATVRPLAQRWARLAVDEGGELAARALPRWMHLEPEAFSIGRSCLQAILDDHSPSGSFRRLAVAEGILSVPSSPVLATFARAVARGLMADGASATPRGHRLVDRIVDRSGDAALRVDRVAAAARAPGTPVQLPAVAAGPAIYDAVALPTGHLAVALGDRGVRVFRPDGRLRAAFDVPAHHLVVDAGSSRMLAVARRGELMQIARIDVAGRRAAPWTTAALTAFAMEFDGLSWVCATRTGTRDDLVVLDATADGLQALHRVEGIPRSPRLRLGPATLQVAGPMDGEEALWTFELPGWRLRERSAPPGQLTFVQGGGPAWALLHAGGEADDDGAPRAVQVLRGAERSRGSRLALPPRLAAAVVGGTDDDGGAWLASAAIAPEGAELRAGPFAPSAATAPPVELPLVALFQEATTARLRAHGRVLTAWASRGRVLAMEGASGLPLYVLNVPD